MHRIASMAIDGFWETHDLKFPLDPEVTFLIGQNGTGKTTLINLLAAALTADFRTLDRIAFKKIVVDLVPEGKEDVPTITVVKSTRKDRPNDLIEYRIKSGKSDDAETKYSLGDPDRQFGSQTVINDPRYVPNAYRHNPRAAQIIMALRSLVNINWLSIHRTIAIEERLREERFESTIDKKLSDQSNLLVRYFNTLSQQKDEEVRLFQESIFISLIDPPATSSTSLFDEVKLQKLDDYIEALVKIFTELRVSHVNTSALMQSFVERGKKAQAAFVPRPPSPTNTREALSLENAVFLIDIDRIERIVARWNTLQERLSNIFSQRDRFLKIVNNLLQRKQMGITESGELQFISRSGKILAANLLSSGEKQLLILLGETLLQRERPSILIADEPELSLHVSWQEKIIASLRTLNPAAQIIVATHSPDIVGSLGNNAIDMETIIS